MSQPRTWMVRAGEGAFRVEEFLEKGIVSIGWEHLGDLYRYSSLEQIRTLYQQTYPNHKPSKFILCSEQVYRFRSEIRIGDHVMTYNPQYRTYSIGKNWRKGEGKLFGVS